MPYFSHLLVRIRCNNPNEISFRVFTYVRNITKQTRRLVHSTHLAKSQVCPHTAYAKRPTVYHKIRKQNKPKQHPYTYKEETKAE